MRTLPCWALIGVLAGCDADITPGAATDRTTVPAVTLAAQPLSDAPSTRVPQAEAQATATTADERTSIAVAELLAQAATGDAVAMGRAPATILLLGDGALPGLTRGLAHADVRQRRIAALTLLQWSESLAANSNATAVVQALASARDDPDPAVCAAAEHAWRRATGDTTTLDQSRAEHEAALHPVR